MLTLRDYQNETIETLLGPDHTEADLVVCATGGGKTVIFAELLNRVLQPGQRGLVLAHRDELIDQAAEKIAWVAPDLVIEREKAEHRAARGASLLGLPTDRGVVVASVQTLRGRRLEEWPRDAFDIVICDEAHHATAATYVAIFDHFRARRVGVTATPARTDGKPLGDVFSRIAVDFGIRHLVEHGWLVPIAARVVHTDTDLSEVKQSAGDYAIGDLSRAVNTDGRNHLIVAALTRWGEGRQTIIYCASVEHARELAAMMDALGITSEAIWGEMGLDERQKQLARFRRGEVRVLTNFGVLTEGFDDPNVGCIVLARPTQSELLLTQMVGRGTRPLEEIAGKLDPESPALRRGMIGVSRKPNVLVIDIQDVTHRLQATVATLAGLPRAFDPQGQDIFVAGKAMEQLDPRLAARCLDLAKLHEMLAKVAQGLSVTEIDVLAATALDPEVARYSRFVWAATGPDHYAIRVDGMNYLIMANTLGTYTVTYRRDEPKAPWFTLGEGYPSAEQAFLRADDRIAKEHPTKVGLIDASAKWRQGGPTEKQLEWLVKKGVFKSASEIPATLTKGMASQMLDAAFAKRGAR